MKIALLNDSHFGARNDSSLFLDHFVSFYENVFFPYCKENGVNTIIHLGDFFDRRKYINFNTLSLVKEKVIDKFVDFDIHLILGNHDSYFKNTLKVNSPTELLSFYDNIKIYENAKDVNFDGTNICLVPWITPESHDDTMKVLKSSTSSIVCGHFELNGYEVFRGVKFRGGLEDKFLKRFEMVLSGHFHSKYSQNNVHYLGTQYQMTFSDLNDQKGFHVLDTETRQLEFIENPDRMFYSLEYDDRNDIDLSQLDETYTNKYVKVIVLNKNNSNLFEKYIDKIYNLDVADLSVVEDFSASENSGTNVDLHKDTIDIIFEEVDNLETVLDKTELKKNLKLLYMEALNNESK